MEAALNNLRHFYGGAYHGTYGQIIPIAGKRTAGPVICAGASICSGGDSEGEACGADADCSGGTCMECMGATAGDVIGDTQAQYVIWYPVNAGYTLEVRNDSSEPWQDPFAAGGFAAYGSVKTITTYAGAEHTFAGFLEHAGNIKVRLR